MVSRLGFVPLQVSVLLRELNSLQPYMMSRERHANGSRSSLIIVEDHANGSRASFVLFHFIFLYGIVRY